MHSLFMLNRFPAWSIHVWFWPRTDSRPNKAYGKYWLGYRGAEQPQSEQHRGYSSLGRISQVRKISNFYEFYLIFPFMLTVGKKVQRQLPPLNQELLRFTPTRIPPLLKLSWTSPRKTYSQVLVLNMSILFKLCQMASVSAKVPFGQFWIGSWSSNFYSGRRIFSWIWPKPAHHPHQPHCTTKPGFRPQTCPQKEMWSHH